MEIGATTSIGTVGDSYDNALAETLNGYYKTKLVRGPARPGPWKSVADPEIAPPAQIKCPQDRVRLPLAEWVERDMNGLRRNYFPKGSDLSIFTPDDLAAVAPELNARPRQTLN